MVKGFLKMVELVVVTAVFDDDHGLVVLNPVAGPVGHDVDLVGLDDDIYLFDVCNVLLCLLLSPDVVELVERWDDDVHLMVLDDLI